jgi:hypothetical protein
MDTGSECSREILGTFLQIWRLKIFVSGLARKTGGLQPTFNRYKAMLSLIYRLAIEHGKARLNPARLLKRKREEGGRIRFLGQYSPLPTEVDFLKDIPDEEGRLRAVLQRHYPFHQPEFDVALHTGMRPSEQYALK